MNEIPNMIQNGSFGNNQPMGYNPYATPMYGNPYQQQPRQFSNMIPVGSYNYNSTGFMNPPQQPNYGYSFNPVQQYNPNPYQPRQDYYNPYPQYHNGNPYYSGYTYNGYGNYTPYMSMQFRERMVNDQVNLNKMKCKLALKFIGSKYDEAKADEMFNPNNPINKVSDEKRQSNSEWKMIQQYSYVSEHQDQLYNPNIQLAYFLQTKISNYHEAFDNHSLCEFVEEDYPRMMREFWIAKYIKRNADRDLQRTYNSSEYNRALDNELIKMHQSSQSPYVNQLLDDSRYNQAGDDLALKFEEVLKATQEYNNQTLQGALDRIRAVANGQLSQTKDSLQVLPTYIASAEVQAQRAKFTQDLMNQIYSRDTKKMQQYNNSGGGTNEQA